MRAFIIATILLLGLAGQGLAQRKVNKMNGLTEASVTKRKYNKQWIKMRQHGLPSFATSVGVNGGIANFMYDDPAIASFGRYTLIHAPQLTFHINPSKFAGFNLGLGYRSTMFSYSTSGSFSNDSIMAIANGEWQQKFGNIGISLGGVYYVNIAKQMSNCTGFGISNATTAHLFIDMGITLAPSLFNEVYFVGNFNEFVNGELKNSGEYDKYTIMYNEKPRREAMFFYYAKLGIRVQNESFSTRIGPVFEYQLNTNRGIANDFTATTTSIMMYGLCLAFEFY
ncbi:MAG: hypothetical protein HYZ16_11785 [Bacteroidetes bacterium]|nr:hypothetical protein [Bacteroidota bacterium]